MNQVEGDAPTRELVAAVLARIIPPESGFPSAVDVALDRVWEMTERPDGGGLALGFAIINRSAGSAFGAGFVQVAQDAQDSTLRRVEAEQPVIFEALVAQTYMAYYSHPSVVRLLGLDPRPPGERAHTLPPMNLQLVEQVRKRPPIYRRA